MVVAEHDLWSTPSTHSQLIRSSDIWRLCSDLRYDCQLRQIGMSPWPSWSWRARLSVLSGKVRRGGHQRVAAWYWRPNAEIKVVAKHGLDYRGKALLKI